MTPRTMCHLALAVVLGLGGVPVRAEEPAIDPESVDDVTLALSKLAVETRADDIPAAAYRAAKRAVLDGLGCAIAGHDAPGVPPGVELTNEWGGREEATVWLHGGKVPGPAAAFTNSVQVHALDYDDVHLPSGIHITSVVVPAAFAMGERHGASGRETLAAIILGIEAAGRVGRAGRPHGGFLPSSVLGGFSSTVAAARLHGCSVEETADALGVWYGHCSGNRQALYDRTLTKRIQPAIAAKAGVFAAHLARKGITGPRRIIGGQAASLNIYGYRNADPPTVGEIMAPRDAYEVEELSYKRYTACGGSHQSIEAALALANEHDLKPADIETIEIFGVGVNSGVVGVPWTDHENPHVLAQFCAPYQVASVIAHRRFGPAEITNEHIAEAKEVDALARRTQLRSGWSREQTVRIVLRDGRKMEATRGRDDVLSPNAHSHEQLVDKFKSNAVFSGRFSGEEAAEMVEAVENLETFDSIGRFVDQYLAPRKGVQ